MIYAIPIAEKIPSWNKHLISFIYGIICFIGIIVGLFPYSCTRVIHLGKNKKESYHTSESHIKSEEILFRGHHPNCDPFSSHILHLGGNIYCASCTGLVIGAFLSLFGIMFYLFFDMFFENLGIPFFWFGISGITIGLFWFWISLGDSRIRFFLNVSFVFGTFLLFIGINELDGSTMVNIYFLLEVLFLIISRIIISRNEHNRICANCKFESCKYLRSVR